MKSTLTLLGLCFFAHFAFAGNELGNGGDAFSQEFVSLGRAMVERLRSDPDPKISDIEALAVAVENTKVITKDSLILDGAEVDAINYSSSKEIEVNRGRWKNYSAKEKAAIVLHEYLGIAHMEDKNYQISGSYSVAKTEFDGDQGQNPLRKRISLGVGSGINIYSGNIGRLYSNSNPLLLRFNYLATSHLDLNLKLELARYEFMTDLTGQTNVAMRGGDLTAQLHTANRSRFDPYLFGGMNYTFRKQRFEAFGSTQEDTAFGFVAGLGMNLFLRKDLGLWSEGSAKKIYFADSNNAAFADAGIPNLQGILLSGSAGLQFLF